jgi:hypothetical protein
LDKSYCRKFVKKLVRGVCVEFHLVLIITVERGGDANRYRPSFFIKVGLVREEKAFSPVECRLSFRIGRWRQNVGVDISPYSSSVLGPAM